MQADPTETPFGTAEDAGERPPLIALVRQLGDDAQAFAKAEAAFIKERVGEGWSHAVPGLAAIGIAVAVVLGAFIALPLGLMMLIGAHLGLALSIPIVMISAALISQLLVKFGQRRLKAAIKMPEDR